MQPSRPVQPGRPVQPVRPGGTPVNHGPGNHGSRPISRGPVHFDPHSSFPHTTRPDGGIVENRGKTQVHYRPDGSREKVVSNNGHHVVEYNPNGARAREVRGANRIEYGQNGARSVYRGNVHRYDERRGMVGNRSVITRTYFRGGRTFERHYESYVWGGRMYYAYHPAWRYQPYFYNYCGHYRWGHPLPYAWGWYDRPWYHHYRYYYRPYSSYDSGLQWLIDWIFAMELEAQYEQDVAYAGGGVVYDDDSSYSGYDVSDADKQQLENQAQADVDAEANGTEISVENTLQDVGHVYVVSDDIDATILGTDSECSLTSGDLIRLDAPASDADPAVQMVVVTAKRDSCKANARVLVSKEDLQSMENDFAEQVSDGMDQIWDQKPFGEIAGAQAL
jgi:hypothetical protein